ncbi:hypothetical protein AWC38_SpisGene21066 [Stylophora pistillata]|uniref:C2H2-type domain-containing protein n=1 Tax=Stylophora pistillata TaxID=50429 RepID=A0A2B4RD72_STYPI|nr:hypothetical protein AWC38_SpisGene21066 [Stylophora pistillata]
MDTTANLTEREVEREPLTFQIKTPLQNLTKREQLNIVQKAKEDCLLVCSVIAPCSGEELFQSTVSVEREIYEGPVSDNTVVLMSACKNAKTRNLKKQILSLYAYRYPINTLKKLHLPYGKISTWEIKQARSHANLHGPGTIPETTTKHRVRLDMGKLDHFIDFVNRPYFYQDVSYGSKILVLDNGDKIEMPNVVRTVTRSTMIEQYLEYCKEQCHEPLSRSTMFKILEIREASQRKSLQGLDNTAADGAAGFQTLETLVETLEKGGMEMQWCLYVRHKLQDAKRYLKTDCRLHCQPDDSTCAAHCRRFALSDPVEPDFQHQCSHEHQSTCGDCQVLKKVLQDVRQRIEGSSWTPYNLDQREDLLYDFNQALENILLWKAHIMRPINQEKRGKRIGIVVMRYDFSEPQYGKDVCDRILCPMKSTIRRYCNEGHDAVSAKDMRAALSERPVRGTTACVCSINETKKTLEVQKIHGFSKYHNFKFEEEGMRIWRAYGIGQGRLIPYQDLVVRPQGSTCLVVDEKFFPLKETRLHKAKKNSDGEQVNDLFACSDPGCNMVFKKFSELESHLDVDNHCQILRNSDTVYDKLRKDWAENFLRVNDEEIDSAPVKSSDE